MRRSATAPRRGFTLIELMVVMSVVIILASIALVVVPSVIEQDRTTEGAGRLQQWIAVARMRAARDQLPRGIKLIWDQDTNKVSPVATEVQYIETAGAVQIPNARLLFSYDPSFPNEQPGQESGRGGFGVYVIGPKTGSGAINTGLFTQGSYIPIREPELGAVTIQKCLTTGQFEDPTSGSFPSVSVRRPDGSTTTLKDLLMRFSPSSKSGGGSPGVLLGQGIGGGTNTMPTPNNNSDADDGVVCKLILDTTPVDLTSALGGTATVRYDPNPMNPSDPYTAGRYPHFGLGTMVLVNGPLTVFPPTTPLLGEPVMQLPKNIGVDLWSCSSGTSKAAASADLNIVFNPGGDLKEPSAGGQLYLWVRDVTKAGGDTAKVPGASFTAGGEQQIVAVKTATGTTRVVPASWTPGNPFEFAKK